MKLLQLRRLIFCFRFDCCNTIKIDKIAAPAIRSYKFNLVGETTDFSKIGLILVRLKLKLQRAGGIRSSIDSIKLAGEQLKRVLLKYFASF
jgi:hypothetical protein